MSPPRNRPPAPQPPPPPSEGLSPIGLRTASIKLKGTAFTINLLDADKGLKRSAQIADYLSGPLLSALLVGASVPEGAPTMVAAMGDLTRKLADDSFRELVWELLEGSTAAGRPLTEPSVFFAGRYDVLMQLVFFAIRENFGSFFGLLPSAVRARLATNLGSLLSQAAKVASSSQSSAATSAASQSSEASTDSKTSSGSSVSLSGSEP